MRGVPASIRRAFALLGSYGIALGVQRVASLLVLPVLTWAMDPAELGAFAVLNTVTLFVFISLVDLGIGTIAFRLAADPDADPTRMFATVLWVRLFASVALLVPVALYRETVAELLLGSADAAPTVMIAWGVLFLRAFTQTMTDWLRQSRRDREVALFIGSLGLLEAGLAVLFVVGLHWGFVGWMAALVSAQLVTSVPLLVWCWPVVTARPHSEMAGRLSRLGIPIGIMQMLFTVRELDRFVIGSLDSLAAAGVYDFALKLAAPLSTLNTVLVLGLEPKALGARDAEDMLGRAGAFLRVYALGTSVAAFAVAMLAPELLLVVDPRYRAAAPLSALLVFLPTFEGLRRLAGLPLDLAKKTRGWVVVAVLNGAVAVAIAFALVPTLSGAGAAIGLLAGAAAGAGAAELLSRTLPAAERLTAPWIRALVVAGGGAALAWAVLTHAPAPLTQLPHRLAALAVYALATFALLPVGRRVWARMSE